MVNDENDTGWSDEALPDSVAVAPPVRPVRRATRPAAPDPEPMPPPRIVAAITGIPSVEDNDTVKAARARHQGFVDQLEDERRGRRLLERGLGLEDPTPDDLDAAAGELLAAGKDIEPIARIEAARKREKQLAAAVKVAAADIAPAIEQARREILPQVVAELVVPARRAEALAWLELIRARKRHSDIEDALTAAGLVGMGGSGKGCLFHTHYPVAERVEIRNELGRLIADKTLAASDIEGIDI
ncbi:MAG: hypothetical protein K8U57_23105 [Planctomycetes bacterium]|nr:hypothetical protein [Planctomycetota bacterium]